VKVTLYIAVFEFYKAGPRYFLLMGTIKVPIYEGVRLIDIYGLVWFVTIGKKSFYQRHFCIK
jgi:hypothetical protein